MRKIGKCRKKALHLGVPSKVGEAKLIAGTISVPEEASG
jgi:hypothetical protein